MIKLAIGIEYNGNAYHGWQSQKNIPNIQDKLEYALSIVANEPIKLFCASRTDTGVHATYQIAHFETKAKRSNVSWINGVNSNLPNDINIYWIISVKNNFHARFSAISRRYRYIIYNNLIRPSIFFNYITHVPYKLNIKKMIDASKYLLGENDFSTFRSSKCQSNSAKRNIYHIFINCKNKYIIIDIKANSFVYHMVRNIVGSLIDIGRNNYPKEWMAQLLFSKNRKLASNTAKANGLYLVEIDYPNNFSLPSSSIGPSFLI